MDKHNFRFIKILDFKIIFFLLDITFALDISGTVNKCNVQLEKTQLTSIYVNILDSEDKRFITGVTKSSKVDRIGKT